MDTGVLLAAADRRDPAHQPCRDLLESHPGPLISTEPVLAETGWLLDCQLGPVAEAALYRSVADGELVVEHLSRADGTRVAELTEQYSDQHLGGVDASLIAVAERLGLTTIATLDRPFRRRATQPHQGSHPYPMTTAGAAPRPAFPLHRPLSLSRGAAAH